MCKIVHYSNLHSGQIQDWIFLGSYLKGPIFVIRVGPLCNCLASISFDSYEAGWPAGVTNERYVFGVAQFGRKYKSLLTIATTIAIMLLVPITAALIRRMTFADFSVLFWCGKLI